MPESISIGDIQLTFVSGGQLRIDGGTMFGVIPRVMWEKVSPPDEQHRIRLDTNCVLVRTPKSLGLIDTGYGGKANPKQRKRNALEEGEPLVRNLAAIGVTPSDIDWLILTHLHFDHAGGATRRNAAGMLQPTFPRARHIIQRTEWEDATGNLPELSGAYLRDDFTPLAEAGLTELVEGVAEVVPGITVRPTGGHTRGHQIIRFESVGESAVLLGDICPTTAHLPTFWTMSYDQYPLEVRRAKPALLHEITAQHRVALLSHDPEIRATRLTQGTDREWQLLPLLPS